MPTNREVRRSEAEADLRYADSFNRMTDMFENLLRSHRTERTDSFKPPTYDGSGDVELFIQNFMEVAEANQWSSIATKLHLKESLKESAKECARYATTDAIVAALKSRYGMTAREARAKLACLRRDPKTSLQEHGSQVERLVAIAHAELLEQYRQEMIIDNFCTSIGNGNLQRHLLAIPTPTLEDAIRAGNEYLQITVVNSRNYPPTAMSVDAAPADLTHNAVSTFALTEVMKAIQNLNLRLDRLEERNKAELQRCYGCGQTGHIRRNCVTSLWPETPSFEISQQSPRSENSQSSQ